MSFKKTMKQFAGEGKDEDEDEEDEEEDQDQETWANNAGNQAAYAK